MSSTQLIKPLSPAEVAASPLAHPSMIKVVNELLRQHFDGSTAVILQLDILSGFLALEPEYTSRRVFDEKLMDFEAVYRQQGWLVAYEKPGYNERGSAFFTFKSPK